MKAVGYLNRDVSHLFVYEALWITGILLALFGPPCIAGHWKFGHDCFHISTKASKVFDQI